MKVLGIVQARMASTRLPGKVMKLINDQPAIYWIMGRAARSKFMNKVILATSDNVKDDVLYDYASAQKWPVFRGDEQNVLSRFAYLVERERPDVVVRINADNFAIDHRVIDLAIEKLTAESLDVVNPFLQHSYPFGVGAEVARASLIGEIVNEINTQVDDEEKRRVYSEHIFFYAYAHPEKYHFDTLEAVDGRRGSEFTVSVDELDDYLLLKKIYTHFQGRELQFSTAELVNYLRGS